jgi:hypothetical protein
MSSGDVTLQNRVECSVGPNNKLQHPISNKKKYPEPILGIHHHSAWIYLAVVDCWLAKMT